MVDALEVPEALAGVGVEGEERVGEEIVADAIAAVEIHDGGAGWCVDDAVFGVEGHAGPVVGGASGLPGVGRPGAGAEFAGARDGAEAPDELAGADVVGADVAGRGGMGFWIAATDDDEVFVDDAGRCEHGGLDLEVSAEVFAEVDTALLAEGGDGLASGGVEAVEVVHDAGEETRTAAIARAAGPPG